jgi:glycosyltransferase involved in cell wall biosynthesis
VKELHEDRVLAQTLARSGREETAQKYSLEKFVSATEKVYDRLLKGM